MIKKKFIFCIFVLMFFILCPKALAGEQKWNSLHYDAELTELGDMEVVETWDIYISSTNTLFKDFYLDESKYSGIYDIRVSKIEDGKERFLEEIYEEQYHVTPGCYYGLPIKDGRQFEIAWNVGFDNTSGNATYKVYYTIKDVIHEYNDCEELYWQFLGTDNSIKGREVTGTIKLPKNVSNLDNLKIWAHGPLNGNIEKASKDTVEFEIDNLSSGKMLEVRVVLENEDLFETVNKINENKLDSILKEEGKWANEANSERTMYKAILLIWVVTNIFFTIFLSIKAKKYKNEGKDIEVPEYLKEEIQYFRDIPDGEKATPATASYMYNFKINTSYIDKSKVFSSTMLDLSIKGLLSFDVIDKNNLQINLLDCANVDPLPDDEQKVYNWLVMACNYYGKTSITTKEFSSFNKKEYDSFYNNMDTVEDYIKLDLENRRIINEKSKEEYEKWNKKYTIYLIPFIFSICVPYITIFFLPVSITWLICTIILSKNRKKIKNILSEYGNSLHSEWNGLNNYLKDYSLMKEKTVPDIILWEKYLVYATTFGISDKVIKQLKVDFPEWFSENYNYGIGRYTYFSTLSNHNYGNDFSNNFMKALSSPGQSAMNAYNAAHSSSSSGGGGGGFSGGGGGRWRRRRLRRSLIKK